MEVYKGMIGEVKSDQILDLFWIQQNWLLIRYGTLNKTESQGGNLGLFGLKT